MIETWSTLEELDWSWEQLAAELGETFLDFTKGQIFYVQVRRAVEDKQVEPERPSLIRRLRGSLTGHGPGNADPLVQFYRMDFCLYCECAGPAESGGSVQLSPEQQEQILALGWAQPEGKNRARWGYPNYCAYFPHEGGRISIPPVQMLAGDYRDLVDAPRAAQLAIDTLRGPLDAPSPDRLTIVRRG